MPSDVKKAIVASAVAGEATLPDRDADEVPFEAGGEFPAELEAGSPPRQGQTAK